MLSLLSLFFFSLSFAEGSAVLFKCQTPVSPFDPDLIQGSEVFIDINYNPETEKLSIYTDPATDTKIPILFSDENTSSYIDINKGSIYSDWKNNNVSTYLSMVYLGSKQWGAALYIKDFMRQRDPSLTSEEHIELFCTETNSFQDLFF